MSSEPPSGNRPTGPPSGPLSGRRPQQPTSPGDREPTRPDVTVPPRPAGGGAAGPTPPGPPAPPTGGRGTPGEGPGRRRSPWWRSRAVLISGAVVVAAALAVYFLRQSGGTGEVFLQSASADGRDPFTKSSAKNYGNAASAAPAAPAGGTGGGTRSIQGATPGLYGGTRNNASCDVERQIGYLNQDQTKARAFAGAAGIEVGGLARYLRSLTPVALRADTRVTNHGFKDGSVTSFQSVLQAGTAVLVDDRGLPRVRCACGNPLGAPIAVKGTPKASGDSWPAYRPSDVVAVAPADAVMEDIVVYDTEAGEWFERPVGTKGEDDRTVAPPKGGVSPGPTRSEASPGSATPSKPSPSTPHSPPEVKTPPPAYGAPPVRAN
ncbi:DUF6777 domain-containing protein [Streptomyces sp. NPDC053079]|uniref:DUF6777 domain-containing protein n=1 Tax=Streptomyces sp. NPDC053079 TaxID=3365697 RepID=UPI0037D30D69